MSFKVSNTSQIEIAPQRLVLTRGINDVVR